MPGESVQTCAGQGVDLPIAVTSVVFPTCAAMHAVFAAYTLDGLYPLDIHTKVIDLLAVPAAIYFVWVVQALYRGTFRDWNEAGRVVPDSTAASAA